MGGGPSEDNRMAVREWENFLTIDLETTTWNNGNPHDPRNFVVCIGFGDEHGVEVIKPDAIHILKERLENFKGCLVGLNFKFDLHWLYNLGLDDYLKKFRVYDVQYAAFCCGHQSPRYPSLDQCAENVFGERKDNRVEQYWADGINTHEIPEDVLYAYCARDVQLTARLAKHYQQFTQYQKLIKLGGDDLKVLLEMERNGLHYNRAKSFALSKKSQEVINKIQEKWFHKHNLECFNWSSNEHLSALLYGGLIKEIKKVPIGTFKTGPKTGQVRFKNEEVTHHLPRMFKPLRGSSKAKEGVYAVDEDTLLKIGAGDLVEDLLLIKEHEKNISTYLEGIPKKQDEIGYDKSYVFTTFNQCVTDTGRLSSTGPNMQNLSDLSGTCFDSRY